jgi:hypothetical protein
MIDLKTRLADAVRQFWGTRHRQAKKSRKKNYGTRTAVTGGAQMDGFIELVYDLLVESGLPEASVFRKSKLELPGYFRPTKEWDILVVADGILLASLEFKSQVGSFGNNYNNRTEEALGNATDLRPIFDSSRVLSTDRSTKNPGNSGFHTEATAEM